jgi:hypothetical protein
MPNGVYDLSRDDWTKIQTFFDGLSPILFTFAVAHNLAIDKYYHDAPAWTFRFRHPRGGGAGLRVERVDDLTVKIGSSWYLDEYESFTRYLKWGPEKQLPLTKVDLRGVLETSLQEIVHWNENDLTAHPDYKNIWSVYTKEEWQQMSSLEQLPELKL